MARARRACPVPLERDVQRSILAYLSLAGVFAWRVNSGAARLPGRNGGTQLVRFNTAPGASDIHGVLPAGSDPGAAPAGRALFIEVKRPGGKATPLQESFLAEARAKGAVAFVASSVEDVRRGLRAAGYEAP